MSANDRSGGLVSSLAVKIPVKCVSSANLTLSGEQTVNGTAVVTGDRVLVKNQTAGTDNGIYEVDTGSWTRSQDFDGNDDVVQGSMVFSYAQLKFYYVTTADPIIIDTSSIAFSQAPVDTSGASAYFATLFTAASASALRALIEITRVAFATGAGTVDAITATFSPVISSYDQTMLMLVECTGANTSTTPTLKPDSLVAKTIVKGTNQALEAGDMPGANFLGLFRYDTSLDKIQLLNPARGVTNQISAPSPTFAQNLGATVTLAANALTFALKDRTGVDPSGSSPIEVYFQSATVTTGTHTKRSITSATSITIPSTALVGTVSGLPSRIYFGLLDNAGTLELCYWNSLTVQINGGGTGFDYDVISVLRVNPGTVHSTVANTAASDLGGVIYSDSARANVRIIPIAYVDSVQATAGTWATAIIRLTLVGPETPLTGDLIQEVETVTGAVATGTTILPLDDTIPNYSTDGDPYIVGTIFTIQQRPNIFDFEAIINFANSAVTDGLAAFISNGISGGTAIVVASGNVSAAGDQQCLIMHARVITKNTTVQGVLTAGGGTAGTTTFNGRASGRLYGGAMGSRMMVREICA